MPSYSAYEHHLDYLSKTSQYANELVSDGYGGTEPRFSCNVVLQGKSEAFKVINTMASVFRGMAYWSAGSVTMTQDKLQDDLGFISGLSGDKARLKDWWLDSEMGIIYFNNSYPFFEWNAIKATYIYGERYLEKAIEDVCTKMVAIELLMADDRSVLIPEGTQNIDLASKVQLYQADVDRTLPKYIEMVIFE